jgi:hypothetical protein
MAKTGYGKRSVGDEDPHADPDFAHLSPRDAEIAVFIDHLEDGHAMGHKVIAAEHPRYGQQAVRTSSGRLVHAGHLRWIKEHITIEDSSMRWVTRTYWSRTPRSVEWWANFARERDGRDVTEHYQSGLARVEESEPAEPAERAERTEPVAAAEPDRADAEASGGRSVAAGRDRRQIASDRSVRRWGRETVLLGEAFEAFAPGRVRASPSRPRNTLYEPCPGPVRPLHGP